MINFKIATDKDSSCGFVTVRDLTSYGSALPDRRSDLGLALFWSDDDWATEDSDRNNALSGWVCLLYGFAMEVG